MYFIAGMTRLAGVVALWQSTEQRCREEEAADAASVTRLVRGALLSPSSERAVVVFVLIMRMLLRCWRGQADAGLGALRTPTVRGGLSNHVSVRLAGKLPAHV